MSNVAYANFAAHSAARSNRMENQKSGYVPLYRSIKKKSWAKDVFLRALWENLLIDAARQPYTAFFKGKQWPLQPGQLVVTAADLGLSCVTARATRQAATQWRECCLFSSAKG